MPKTQNSPNTAGSKRAQLVEAALRLFEREGCHSTGIDRILEEAGVAKMTLSRMNRGERADASDKFKDGTFNGWSSQISGAQAQVTDKD